jgi:hypothetical protein
MGKIYDYNSYSYSRGKGSSPDQFFEYNFSETEMDFHNMPFDSRYLQNTSAYLKYSVSFSTSKSGITGINFTILEIEISNNCDEIEGEVPIECQFDYDIIPGKTIDIGQIRAEIKSCPIPTDPCKITIDMNNSTDVRKFNVQVEFGVDRDY